MKKYRSGWDKVKAKSEEERKLQKKSFALRKKPYENAGVSTITNVTGDGKHCIENVNNEPLYLELAESLSVPPDCLSDTRWSAHHDALDALLKGYTILKQYLY